MRAGHRGAAWTAGVLLVLFVGLCLGVPGLDVLLLLATGWIEFLRRVGPQLDVRWDLVGSALAYAAALVVGSHFFLRWLYREMRRRGKGGGTDAAAVAVAPAWRWRWTLGAFAILVLMFAAGTAAVGIAHQTAWLARSPGRLYVPYSAGGRLAQLRCRSNLFNLGQALWAFADAHGGRYPDDLSMLSDDDLHGDRHALTCPAAPYAPPPEGVTPAQHAAEIKKPGYTSYFYFGRGASKSGDAGRVIACESLENHEGRGINVLYAHGRVEWLDAPEAERLLLSLGFERVESMGRR